MMAHSKKLEDTKLWKAYQKKLRSDKERTGWVKEVCSAAEASLKAVRQTFENYTLHDETHILNVLDAMGGILGDQINSLTGSEMELLILSASLHDLGMVYTEAEKAQCYMDKNACRKFLREHCPEFLGCPPEDWPPEVRQWYLRSLHPFRIPQVLRNEAWQDLLEKQPHTAVSKQCVLCVCQAHGETMGELQSNPKMEYREADDADPLFCALLLRLADLLDFDDTRAPRVLYGYAADIEKSCEEWKKHQASAGFRYPRTPSTKELPYKARCKDPGIEHTVRDFLNWIDEELDICIKLQKKCHAEWQRDFPFPRAVSRREIESDGYVSGDFQLTMDQTKILKLLTGENLYESGDVFVRELLQNAIDATLLRGEMDRGFSPEEARIDLWEWNDGNGYIWFRIDDQGTGMTLGMLKRYFLKVGNSYYTSQELRRDLRDHNQTREYNGISRFGIGFLSCFLCGSYAEVSTLYFDPEKNRRETERGTDSAAGHGLRLQVTGLTGYYTLKSQAEQHMTDAPLNAPDLFEAKGPQGLECGGYRVEPGTSIAIRLDPGKLGVVDLRESVKKYLCCARVPVYYNGERIGRTYGELMEAAHETAGEQIYELSREAKERFDKCFPHVQGQYPKVAVTVIPLDAKKYQALPGLSGVLIKYDVRFDKAPQWEEKDQAYQIDEQMERGDSKIKIVSRNKKRWSLNESWRSFKRNYSQDHIAALTGAFMKLPSCPVSPEQLGDVWKPFERDRELHEVWRSWMDAQQETWMDIELEDIGCPTMRGLAQTSCRYLVNCCYQGIVAGELAAHAFRDNNFQALFLLENEYRPVVDVSRAQISELPLETLTSICSILKEWIDECHFGVRERRWEYSTLAEWRKIRASGLHEWLWAVWEKRVVDVKEAFQKSVEADLDNPISIAPERYLYDAGIVLLKYLLAYFQDTYQMTIDYPAGQVLAFSDRPDGDSEETYDLFPPMMFCKAANEESRQYLCAADAEIRRGITADHPFAKWLLENAGLLDRYYRRQFQQIVRLLCTYDADEIVKACGNIREQLCALPERHGVNMKAFPKLSAGDFWRLDEKEAQL